VLFQPTITQRDRSVTAVLTASTLPDGSHLQHLFPYLPSSPGYHKQLSRLGPTIGWLVGMLARDTIEWTDRRLGGSMSSRASMAPRPLP